MTGGVSRETGGPAARLVSRCAGFGVEIELAAAGVLVALLDRIALEPQNLTAIDGLEEGIDRHLADSLAALALPCLAGAPALVDVGSGVGFPGLALAVARPEIAVTLVESERRKAEWLERASEAIPNVRIVNGRSENLARDRREQWRLATARALAPLPVAVELVAPLVRVGGTAVIWRGDRDPAAEEAARRAGAAVGLTPGQIVPVAPFAGSRRHLHTFAKTAPTPGRYPRRPGQAAKRPLG